MRRVDFSPPLCLPAVCRMRALQPVAWSAMRFVHAHRFNGEGAWYSRDERQRHAMDCVLARAALTRIGCVQLAQSASCMNGLSRIRRAREPKRPLLVQRCPYRSCGPHGSFLLPESLPIPRRWSREALVVGIFGQEGRGSWSDNDEYRRVQCRYWAVVMMLCNLLRLTTFRRRSTADGNRRT